MDVPPAEHPAWGDVVAGKVKVRLDFFAGKILLGWLLLKVESEPSDDMIQACVLDLHHLFAQNADLPCVQHDLEQIFGEVSSERMHARRGRGTDED